MHPLQACAALPDGNELKGNSGLKDYFGVLLLGSYVGECGLPASTLKLTPPALTTCEGAAYKYSSLGRYRAPVCMGGHVSVCFYCVTVTVNE